MRPRINPYLEDYRYDELREGFLATCLVGGADERLVLSDGTVANNKVIAERMQADPDLAAEMVHRIGGLVMQHDPQFIYGVPSGGTWLAIEIAKQHDISVVTLTRDRADKNKFTFKHPDIDRDLILANLERGVLVEDVFRTFKNSRAALAIPGLAEKTVAAKALLDRLEPGRLGLSVPHAAVIEEYIPIQINTDSQYNRYL